MKLKLDLNIAKKIKYKNTNNSEKNYEISTDSKETIEIKEKTLSIKPYGNLNRFYLINRPWIYKI